MSVTNFDNGITSFGMPVYGTGGFPFNAPGKHFWVDAVNGRDAQNGKTFKNAKQSFAAGYALMTTGNNDVLHVVGGATAYACTAVLTMDKDYCHVVAHAPFTFTGGRARLTNTVTTATAGEYLISGTGCSFVNIHFQHGDSATATSVVGVAISGNGRNSFVNCHFEGPINATLAGGTAIKPLMLTSTQDNSFNHCTFGARTILSNSAAGALVHFAGTNNNANTFEDCLFLAYNSTTSSASISYVDGAMPDSAFTLFKDCIFQNCTTTAVADPIRYTTAGHGTTILKDCALSGLGYTVWATGAWKTHVDVCTAVASATGGLGIHPT
jgi:hypothetical protein